MRRSRHSSTAGRADQAAEDAGEFVQATLARPKAGPPGRGRQSPTTQKPPGRRADVASEPGPSDRRHPVRLPELRGGVPRGFAVSTAGLRTHRIASRQAGRHPDTPVRRPLRLLRRTRDGRSAARAGTRITVRSVHRGDGGLPPLCPCHRYGTVGDADGGTLSLSISEGAISNILARARGGHCWWRAPRSRRS